MPTDARARVVAALLLEISDPEELLRLAIEARDRGASGSAAWLLVRAAACTALAGDEALADEAAERFREAFAAGVSGDFGGN